MYNKLPLMPTDLNVVVLKPADTNDTDNTADRTIRQLQFTREFTVRKDVVLIQLRFLKANHPGYRNVTINYQVDLPNNANVIDQVANSRYNDNNSSGKDKTGNQRLRIQLEPNPANSAEEEALYKDNGFDSSTILAINADRDIEGNLDDLRR